MSNMYKRTKNDPRLTKDRKSNIRGGLQRLNDFFTRRGTNPWKVTLTKKSIPWARILAPILMVTISVMVIMIVDNGLMRLPDLYKYHFLSNDILNERMISADEDKIAKLMSDYLIHKTDRFQMKEDLEYLPANVFTKEDGGMMHGLRFLLDVQAIMGLIMLFITVMLIIYIIRKKERDLLLQYFLYSLPVFAVMKLTEIGIMMFHPIRTWVFGIPSIENTGKDNLIPALLNDSFFRFLALAEVAVSLILLAVIYFIILNLSGRKATFRR